MKRKAALVALLSCLLVIGAAVPAMAAAEVIDYVYMSIVTEEDLYEIGPGDIVSEMEPMLWDEDYYTMTDYEVKGDSNTPKTRYYYSIELEAEDGYCFDRNTIVSVYGAYEVSFSLRNSNKTMVVTARTYPFYVMDEVSGITIDTTNWEASWDPVDCAKSYSVYVYYTDSRGNEKSAKKTAKSTTLDLSSYKKYAEYGDIFISVKGLRDATDTQRKYILETNYVFPEGDTDDTDYVDYYEFTDIPCDYSSDLPEGVSGNPFDPNAVQVSAPSTNPGTTAPPATTPDLGTTAPPATTNPGTVTPPAATTPVQADGWYGSGEDWYYIKNGQRVVSDWLNPKGEEWYFFDALGNMCHGWLNLGSEVYWLNESHDGTYGRMLAGYRVIGGQTYYFNETHDGTYGNMYVNRRTPDGRYAGADGVVR